MSPIIWEPEFVTALWWLLRNEGVRPSPAAAKLWTMTYQHDHWKLAMSMQQDVVCGTPWGTARFTQ